MAGLTTTANFVALENVGAAELNAIIAGASLTHDCVDGQTNVGFDATGQYLTSVGAANLRKVSGQQIIDGVGSSVTLITNRTSKAAPVGTDGVLLYDQAAAQMKSATVASLTLAAFGAGWIGSPAINGSRVVGVGNIGAAAINLGTPYTGQIGNAGFVNTLVGQRALILFVVTYFAPAGAMTAWDIQIGRQDGVSLYHPTAGVSTVPAVNSNGTLVFATVDPSCIAGPSQYRLHMSAATNPINIADISSFVLVVT